MHAIAVRERRPWQEVLALDVEIPRPDLDEYFREVECQVRACAERAATSMSTVTVTIGDPGPAILKHAREIHPDLVILGKDRVSGFGGKTRLVRPASERTIRKAIKANICPVVCVPR